MHKLIASFKHNPNNIGYIDIIFLLESRNRYDYIQNNCFLGQLSSKKVFLFKMSINGPTNGVDLVMQLQLVSDLENAWICLIMWSV
jgi:hypothetical protein